MGAFRAQPLVVGGRGLGSGWEAGSCVTGGPDRALAMVLIRNPWPFLPVNSVQDRGE